MKRRATTVATTVIVVAVLAVGLGAQLKHSPATLEEICEDLDERFESCARGVKRGECEFASEELADACQAGCVRLYCPEKVPCTGLDPIWCAPCSDMYGATFHTVALYADDDCTDKFQIEGRKFDLVAAEACWKEEMERRCPALAGTD